MNEVIERELAVLFDSDNTDIERTIEAMQRLKTATRKEDVPRLVEALKSDRNNFWTRELLAEPICEIGGSEYLPELFDAFEQNFAEGHDNDGFAHHLMEIAWSEPGTCKDRLLELLDSDNLKYRDNATWLLEFCK